MPPITATAPNPTTSERDFESLGAILERADDPEARAARRVVEAAEEFYAAARAYGLDPEQAREQFYVPLRVRADAWLWRSSQLIDCPRCQRPFSGTPVPSGVEWTDNLPAIRQMMGQNARAAA